MAKTSKKTDPKKGMELSGGTKRNDPKYSEFRADYKAGRNAGSIGKKPNQQYAMGVGPRVGGSAKKATPLVSATKKQMKAAKSMVRKGTGSGAKKRI